MPVILYTKPKSHYLNLQVECYDKSRNALTYQGDEVIIAHPPCDHWATLKQFTKRPKAEKYLTLHALWLIECNGGILEHPARSQIWKYINQNRTAFTGQIISVNLSWFGFPAEKRTYLYIKGAQLRDIPAHPISFDAITHIIGNRRKGNKSELNKSLRNETPLAMCKWLLEVARVIENKKHETGLRTAINRHS